jgi:hypothetical protein
MFFKFIANVLSSFRTFISRILEETVYFLLLGFVFYYFHMVYLSVSNESFSKVGQLFVEVQYLWNIFDPFAAQLHSWVDNCQVGRHSQKLILDHQVFRADSSDELVVEGFWVAGGPGCLVSIATIL